MSSFLGRAERLFLWITFLPEIITMVVIFTFGKSLLRCVYTVLYRKVVLIREIKFIFISIYLHDLDATSRCPEL